MIYWQNIPQSMVSRYLVSSYLVSGIWYLGLWYLVSRYLVSANFSVSLSTTYAPIFIIALLSCRLLFHCSNYCIDSFVSSSAFLISYAYAFRCCIAIYYNKILNAVPHVTTTVHFGPIFRYTGVKILRPQYLTVCWILSFDKMSVI